MWAPPRTREVAVKRRYGEWSGNPKGNPFNPAKCAYSVWANWTERQCSRPPGHGPGDLYCKQHAKIVEGG